MRRWITLAVGSLFTSAAAAFPWLGGCGSSHSSTEAPAGASDAAADATIDATALDGTTQSCEAVGDGGLSGIPVSPYVNADAELGPLEKFGHTSFYLQPWRGYLETVPAVQFLDGIGVNYSGLMGYAKTDEASAVKLMADIGIKTFRIEVGWNGINWAETGFTSATALTATLDACKQYGITPLILLNANSGAPGPIETATATVKTTANTGATQLTLDSVTGFVVSPNGGPNSGLSLPGYYAAAAFLFTSIDVATNTVTLSQPLASALTAGTQVKVVTLKHLPLYPVGTPQFNETMGGWLKYVNLVAALVSAHVPTFEIEIWNELSFGSQFVSINDYYSPPLIPNPPDGLKPGGSEWELGHQTGALLKSTYPATSRIIWGFSNTTFYHTPISELPPEMDGQSYHPYGTGPAVVCDPASPENDCYPGANYLPTTLEHYVPFGLTRCMPEGWAHQGEQFEQIIRLLYPPARTTAKPDGGTGPFVHYFTEDGLAPSELGITDGGAAQEAKAKMMLRAYLFWLNKGLTRLEMFEAYENDDTGFGLLAASPAPSTYDGGAGEQAYFGAAGLAVQHMVQGFAGAVPITNPRSLTIDVASEGPEAIAFSGDGGDYPADANATEAGHPDFPYRDMFTFLPFQVNDHRFVAGVYVMSWDQRSPPPPMTFQVRIGPLTQTCAKISYYDPIADTSVPATVVGLDPIGHTITVELEATDSARLLTIDDSP